jgi:hypothetical protein
MQNILFAAAAMALIAAVSFGLGMSRMAEAALVRTDTTRSPRHDE